MDHCRIGSLEKSREYPFMLANDHCRIGSLETPTLSITKKWMGSLPHRQLRNATRASVAVMRRSLPHRQLRKIWEKMWCRVV